MAMDEVFRSVISTTDAQPTEQDSEDYFGRQTVENPVLQLKYISEPRWIRSFLKQNTHINRYHRKRPLEEQKAAKYEVKLVLAHFRNVYQAEALCQIQQRVGQTGVVMDGFE